MHESGVGPLSPGIAHKMFQMVQNNEPTLCTRGKTKTLFDLTEREREILQHCW